MFRGRCQGLMHILASWLWFQIFFLSSSDILQSVGQVVLESLFLLRGLYVAQTWSVPHLVFLWRFARSRQGFLGGLFPAVCGSLLWFFWYVQGLMYTQIGVQMCWVLVLCFPPPYLIVGEACALRSLVWVCSVDLASGSAL
jgi:hypothetical protein